MSRGNHESENMNKMYGFEGEVKAKYSANMVDLFTGLLEILIIKEKTSKQKYGIFHF